MLALLADQIGCGLDGDFQRRIFGQHQQFGTLTDGEGDFPIQPLSPTRHIGLRPNLPRQRTEANGSHRRCIQKRSWLSTLASLSTCFHVIVQTRSVGR